jgi:hypothetical protein
MMGAKYSGIADRFLLEYNRTTLATPTKGEITGAMMKESWKEALS